MEALSISLLNQNRLVYQVVLVSSSRLQVDLKSNSGRVELQKKSLPGLTARKSKKRQAFAPVGHMEQSVGYMQRKMNFRVIFAE